jgi:hypothetical protein
LASLASRPRTTPYRAVRIVQINRRGSTHGPYLQKLSKDKP